MRRRTYWALVEISVTILMVALVVVLAVSLLGRPARGGKPMACRTDHCWYGKVIGS